MAAMYMAPAQHEIAVIGAGAVGLACALHLHDAGHDVCLIAPEDEESGASYGNAGVIADYAVLPIGTPDLLHRLPALLWARDSPLALHKAALATLAPWLLRFALECLPGRARANADAIAALLSPAGNAWRALAARIDATAQLRGNGALMLYEHPDHALRLADYRAHGVTVTPLDEAALGQMEPALRGQPGGALFPDAMTLHDPAAVMRALRAALAAVPRYSHRVTELAPDAQGVTLTGPGLALRATRVVVAAGAWARPLAAMTGDRVPLDTERGYHLEYALARLPLARHVSPVARGFYLCPMAGRLRVAGTVELGGRDAPPDPRRWALLDRGARALLGDLPPPCARWVGCRPSLPDSRPVIGPATGNDRVIHAFGHGHLGLTLAPVTARIVAALVAGARPPVPVAPYRPGRF